MGFKLLELSVEDADQVFSYHYEDTLLHFNASLLARIHKEVPELFRKYRMTITEAEYDLCMQHRGIEEPKVERLRGKDLRAPGYSVLFEKSYSEDIPSHTIIDGHHRLVRRYRGGIKFMDFYMCQRNVWQHCLMPSTPELDQKIAAALPPKVYDDTNIFSTVRMQEG